MSFKSFIGKLLGRGPGNAHPPVQPPRPMDPALMESLREQLRRPAIVMEIGGFRPPEGLGGSWFGRVNLALPGEAWPTSGGKPMHALAQVDLTQLPFRPARLDDVAMITVFISHPDLPTDEPNGDRWCLRAYPDISRLVPLAPVDMDTPIKPFPMRPVVVEAEYPNMEDLPDDLYDELDEDYYDAFKTAGGFKLGGWPSLVQTAIEWPEGAGHPAAPEYVFQIDSTEKGNWMWADSGVGYFGRGTAPGETDVWTLTWQCY
jgi:hypothetical protein